ncbi:MAG: nucleotidyltransferase [bacterium]|nr:nucleotidyltransferase [bacterium]MBU1916797.1 nucleotidyltransferase [bacterium]
MQDLQDLLKFLIHSPIDFVIVGGFAAVIHGCNQTTRDIDICLTLSNEQIILLQKTLEPINPRHRKQKEKPQFQRDNQNVEKFNNLHLETDLGVLDIITQVEGVGDYYDILKNSQEIELFGGRCFVISLEDLIKAKKTLGRHRDLVIVEELEAIKKENEL